MVVQEFREFLERCSEMDLIQIRECAKDAQDFETAYAVDFERERRSNKACSRRVQGCGVNKYHSKNKVMVGRTRG